MCKETFYNTRLIEVSNSDGHSDLVFDYLGETLRRETFPVIGSRPSLWLQPGKVGAVMRVRTPSAPGAKLYRFEPYFDQSLRRAFEFDIFEHDRALVSTAGNLERVGWRNDTYPDGFLAPAGLIPGDLGAFIADKTERIELDVPPEFVALCAQYGQSAEDVLRAFIADSSEIESLFLNPRADGYSSNGSDERHYAREYLNRTFGMFPAACAA